MLETKIWFVEDSRYPASVKYRLIFVDTKSGRRVLIDNHYPKGPHYHLDEKEFAYFYLDERQLVADFRALVFQHFGMNI